MLNRLRRLRPGRFDVEVEKAGMRYSFGDLDGMSWCDRPVPKAKKKRAPQQRAREAPFRDLRHSRRRIYTSAGLTRAP